MVVFKGTQRIFDKIIEEDSTSTIQNRIISLYGVTSYEDIANVTIQVISSFEGKALTNIKINDLGFLPLKMLDKNGIEIMVEDNWVIPNQVYTIMYRNNSFLLLSGNLNNSNNTYEIPGEIITLTSSSTTADINTIFDSNESEFIESVLNRKSISILGEDFRISITYSVKEIDSSTINIILEFIYNGNYYKQTHLVNSSTETITGVTVDIVDLLSINTNS